LNKAAELAGQLYPPGNARNPLKNPPDRPGTSVSDPVDMHPSIVASEAASSRPLIGRVVRDWCLLHHQGPRCAWQTDRQVGGRRGPALAAHDVHRGTRRLRREGIARLDLWMRYQWSEPPLWLSAAA